MVNTKVRLCGIPLDNPVIPASGTFGYGYEFAELYDIDCLGTFSFKGTTREPRFGNPTPRIAECPGGMLNAVGLQNPGVDAVIAEELPRLAKCFHKPVMANVSGFSETEYIEVCKKLDAVPQVGWIEVNISCPNVHGGGMSFGTSCEAAGNITAAVRRAVKKPLYHQAFTECDGYRFHRQGLRGGRRGWNQPYQHASRHADRSEKTKTGARQRDGRFFRTGRLSGGGAHGLSGL